jgi:alanine-synthesizing transaminase
MINEIDGITCVKPSGTFYMFPKIDTAKFDIKSDEKFVLDLLRSEKMLLVHGSGFNWPMPDHFRLVFLPRVDLLENAINRMRTFMMSYKQIQ